MSANAMCPNADWEVGESGKEDTVVHIVDFGTLNSMEGEEDS
jgi:hypothetical protein